MSRHKAENLLETSPFDDDLQAELAAQPARRGPSKLTLSFGAGVVLVAGLLAGIQAQKTFGSPAAPSFAAGQGNAGATRGQGGGQAGGQAGGQGGGGGFGGQGGGGFAGAGGNATIGTVQRVAGGTIYIKTAQGDAVTVKTTSSTKIQVTATGKATDLRAGTSVVVSGDKGADGTVNATSVSQGSPPGGRQGS
ncbi:hypothetical protein Psi02_62220 [Planotetraspora silvatica]|uniref:DUF5666 domain-containing protein n=1 Tax=Planotetraspora silvatica TaxID=234614 RepID=A0A8J3UPS3_9ACTN|nr:hypothetical protein [Planotetraspora silvatica]GII49798.1 hypothetical protein Psi02_62220 [Planotetraspora silvatica]